MLRYAFVCLLLTTVVSPAQERSSLTLESTGQAPLVTLAYKFTPGQFAHYEVGSKMTIVTQKGEVKAKATNESQTWKNYRVVTVDEQGHATLEPVVTRVKMTARFESDPPVTYDSETDAEPPKSFQGVANAINRANARMTFAPNGELLRIVARADAPDDVKTAAEKTDPQYNFLIVLPGEPVGAGAVWKDRFQVPVKVGQGLTQTVTLQRQYTLSTLNGAMATIAFKTSVVTPINNSEVEGQLIQRTPSGLIEFDVERGLIVSQTASVNQQVVNPLGPQTLLQASSQSHEKLVPAVQQTSLR